MQVDEEEVERKIQDQVKDLKDTGLDATTNSSAQPREVPLTQSPRPRRMPAPR